MIKSESKEQGVSIIKPGFDTAWVVGVQSTHQQILGGLHFAHQNVLHIEVQQGTL